MIAGTSGRFGGRYCISSLGWINANLHINCRARTELEHLLREINGAEGAHWVMCLVCLAVASRFFLKGRMAYGYGMLWVNIPFNLYPIMLHRRNRGRVVGILPAVAEARREPVLNRREADGKRTGHALWVCRFSRRS